ncbi:hypothetical protein CBOM_00754 [Ceraceosorus bombacis]|uniref:Uncharacterized protein n=1 Tax=Ceraceosorus bombacis TaxID=401625 RepID=A0A0P1BA98_9BASI|nr:hypothetical protein CBOM_00754 [Ceraceosorus bombacis]
MVGLPKGPLPGHKRKKSSNSSSSAKPENVKRAHQAEKRNRSNAPRHGGTRGAGGGAGKEIRRGTDLVHEHNLAKLVGRIEDSSKEKGASPMREQGKKRKKSFPESMGASHLAQLGLDIAKLAEAKEEARLRKNKESAAFKKEKRRRRRSSDGRDVGSQGGRIAPPPTGKKGNAEECVGDHKDASLASPPNAIILSKTATKRNLIEEQRAKARARKAARRTNAALAQRATHTADSTRSSEQSETDNALPSSAKAQLRKRKSVSFA